MPLAAPIVLALAACGDNLPAPQPDLTEAEQAFVDLAMPALAYCQGCHWKPEHGYAFLAGDTPVEIRDTLLASGVVDKGRAHRAGVQRDAGGSLSNAVITDRCNPRPEHGSGLERIPSSPRRAC